MQGIHSKRNNFGLLDVRKALRACTSEIVWRGVLFAKGRTVRVVLNSRCELVYDEPRRRFTLRNQQAKSLPLTNGLPLATVRAPSALDAVIQQGKQQCPNMLMVS